MGRPKLSRSRSSILKCWVNVNILSDFIAAYEAKRLSRPGAVELALLMFIAKNGGKKNV